MSPSPKGTRFDFSDIPDTELAWAAGFFDGEGTVVLKPHNYNPRCLVDRNFYRHLALSVSQKDQMPLLKLKGLFGGFISSDKPNWKWEITTRGATAVLAVLLPYLVVKTERAKAGILWQSTMRKGQNWNPLTEEELDIRRQCLEVFGKNYAFAA